MLIIRTSKQYLKLKELMSVHGTSAHSRGTVECPVPNPLRTSTHGPLMSPTHRTGAFSIHNPIQLRTPAARTDCGVLGFRIKRQRVPAH
jgi:hypothetical protein